MLNSNPSISSTEIIKTPLSDKKHLLVDDFIDDSRYNTKDMKDARFFFLLHRLPASLRFDFEDHIKSYKLVCKYDGEMYRVTGASRLGDIWLRKDHSKTLGYDKRVYIDQCSEFKLFKD